MLGGFARLARRSVVATCTFFLVAMGVAQVFPAALAVSPPSLDATISLATILILQLPALIYTAVPFLLPASLSTPIAAFFIGTHFSCGLSLAGMTRPSKVLGFFYVPLSFLPLYGKRDWDPSLSLVAIGGLFPSMLVWRLMRRRATPLWNTHWELPTKTAVDWRLVGGSALFGVGWGERSPLLKVSGPTNCFYARQDSADFVPDPHSRCSGRSERIWCHSSRRVLWAVLQVARCNCKHKARFNCCRLANECT
mgnify:CR=1 FL=1